MEYEVFVLVWRDRTRNITNCHTYFNDKEANMAYEGCIIWPENDAELMRIQRGGKVEGTIYLRRNFEVS